MATPLMHRMHYPIETDEAYAFWASRHKCNRLKAIIAFSETLADANFNLRRMGYQFHLRRRALTAYGAFVANPSMAGMPLSPMSIPWWECLPEVPVPPIKGRWTLWVDDEMWIDTEQWQEWTPDPVAPTP